MSDGWLNSGPNVFGIDGNLSGAAGLSVDTAPLNAPLSGVLDSAPFVNPSPKTLTILMPALDEAIGITRVLEDLPWPQLAALGFRTSVLVVDGHSQDGTAAIAKAFGARVFIQSGRGKGNAFREVLPYLDGDYTVMLDADSSYPPRYIVVLAQLLSLGYDVVTGSRLRGRITRQAMSDLHRIGNLFLTILANLLFWPRKTSDVCTGFWAFRREALSRLRLLARGFELEADLFAEACRLGLRYAEIPIHYKPRSGRAKLSWKNGLRIAMTLIRKRIEGSSKLPSSGGLVSARGIP